MHKIKMEIFKLVLYILFIGKVASIGKCLSIMNYIWILN